MCRGAIPVCLHDLLSFHFVEKEAVSTIVFFLFLFQDLSSGHLLVSQCLRIILDTVTRLTISTEKVP